MWLCQTKLEIDLTKVYKLNGQEVYLTKHVTGCTTQIVTKKSWEVNGKESIIYPLNIQRKKQLIEIEQSN